MKPGERIMQITLEMRGIDKEETEYSQIAINAILAYLDEEIGWIYERLHDQNNGFVKLSERIEKLEKEAKKPKYPCPNCHRIVDELIELPITNQNTCVFVHPVRCKYCVNK